MTSSTTDPKALYFYSPSLPASILFTVLYSLTTIVLFYQVIRHKSLYILVLPIAAFVELTGYVIRCYSVKHIDDVVRLLFLYS
jgi:hypothetical protein